MCAIFGVIRAGADREDLHHLFDVATVRGRDGFGFVSVTKGSVSEMYRQTRCWDGALPNSDFEMLIGNARAEPTTEWVKDKVSSDQQPYASGDWVIVHNGTVANDTVLRNNELPTKIDSAAIAEFLSSSKAENLDELLSVIIGSYAILAIHKPSMTLHVACNYRPIWMSRHKGGLYFGSSRSSVPSGKVGRSPEMLRPYMYLAFNTSGRVVRQSSLKPMIRKNKTLVVCSAGLDSTVAAKVCKDRGDDVTLIHFRYGSRAQGREVRAIHSIAEELKTPLIIKDIPVYDAEDSNLLNQTCDIAGGEQGAEYAHEWVPARNLVMLAVATAYAEAKGFNKIVLGNNLEEAGAYPDNEPEFIAKFNDILPFAVGDGKQVEIEMPVGNMMKHEIVKLGLSNGAPLHLTWSCYKNGTLHCGVCGPCYMRRKAFEINGAEEVIEYASEH